VVVNICHPSFTDSVNPRIKDLVGLGINPIEKKTKAKRVGGIAKVVKHLPSEHKALRSNPNTT
jgi:hypothetical protein